VKLEAKARMGDVIPIRRAPTQASLSDEALVAACALGDASALGALFDRHQEALYRFLDRLARRDPSDVDDLVQSTFVEVWRSAAKFRGGAAVRTWLFGIAANLVRHRARSVGRRRAAMAGLAVTPPSAAAGPEDDAMRRQLVDRLGAALETLSHDLREVFVLCEIEEVPGVDVARALGLREGTVWRRLHDARKALRQALEGGRR
jgi:RNA polymerase sigma factor (sigma-70 family)